jgi:hypothetical protein
MRDGERRVFRRRGRVVVEQAHRFP